MQVGFGLASDLSAIATALGPQNSSCTALTNSAVELLLLSRKFRRDHSETIPKVVLPAEALHSFSSSASSDGPAVHPRYEVLECINHLMSTTSTLHDFSNKIVNATWVWWSRLQAEGPGLAGLIQGLFGKTMDKSLQCSSWGARPLTPAQVKIVAWDWSRRRHTQAHF